MRLSTAVPILAILGLTVACARLAVYDNPQLAGSETGIRFYTAKPYILVSETGKGDKPLDVSVVYLPDMDKPQYVQAQSGVGMGKLSMEFSNSILTKFGQETDTKIPELIKEVGGLAKSLAEIRAAEAKEGVVSPEKFQLYEIVVVDGRTQLIRVKPK